MKRLVAIRCRRKRITRVLLSGAPQNDLPKAIADFTDAIMLDPDEPIYYTNRANAHDLVGSPLAASADREMAAKLRELGRESKQEEKMEEKMGQNWFQKSF